MNLPPADVRRIELLRKVGWVKSSRSTSSLCCVEVLADSTGWVHIRDSKYRRDARGPWHLEPMHSVAGEEFGRLLDLVAGVADTPLVDLYIEHEPGGDVLLGSRVTGTVLRFFEHEWSAFRHGARHGEFTPERLSVLV